MYIHNMYIFIEKTREREREWELTGEEQESEKGQGEAWSMTSVRPERNAAESATDTANINRPNDYILHN